MKHAINLCFCVRLCSHLCWTVANWILLCRILISPLNITISVGNYKISIFSSENIFLTFNILCTQVIFVALCFEIICWDIERWKRYFRWSSIDYVAHKTFLYVFFSILMELNSHCFFKNRLCSERWLVHSIIDTRLPLIWFEQLRAPEKK